METWSLKAANLSMILLGQRKKKPASVRSVPSVPTILFVMKKNLYIILAKVQLIAKRKWVINVTQTTSAKQGIANRIVVRRFTPRQCVFSARLRAVSVQNAEKITTSMPRLQHVLHAQRIRKVLKGVRLCLIVWLKTAFQMRTAAFAQNAK
jgi:hypothetical protein